MEDNIIEVLINRAKKFKTKEVFRHHGKTSGYESLNWLQLKSRVDNVLSSLHAINYTGGEKIGIYSSNKPQWMIADLGIMASGGVVVPFYATASREQLQYIVNETGMRLLFVGNQLQLDLALTLFQEPTTLEKIVVFDDFSTDHDRVISFDQFLNIAPSQGVDLTMDEMAVDFAPQRLATIIYTSGTTGEPKGVMLTHDNFMYCFDIHDQRLDVNKDDVSLCFLPLSHVFERLWSHYLLHKGALNVFLENPKEVIDALPVVKPTLMCTVPRFFDKTYQGIQAEISKWSTPKRRIFDWSVAVGHKALEYKCRSKKVPWSLKWKTLIADKLVFSKLRSIFGGRVKTLPCSGAAISTTTLKFFHAIGIFVNYGYGATETTATVSCFRDDMYFFGTCGTVMPGVDVKIAENGEILVKGRTVFAGYYKKELQTAEVMKDGWFYTGDEGYMDDQRNLIMIDRIKDLMKTSVGKYVSPQKLELLLSQDELVEQLIVVGDNRQYVSALIVPSMDKLAEVARQSKIEFDTTKELIAKKSIQDLFEKRFANLQESLTDYEKVVKFTLLDEPFTIEGGTMTNTLKLRRSSIERTYKKLISDMYD